MFARELHFDCFDGEAGHVVRHLGSGASRSTRPVGHRADTVGTGVSSRADVQQCDAAGSFLIAGSLACGQLAVMQP